MNVKRIFFILCLSSLLFWQCSVRYSSADRSGSGPHGETNNSRSSATQNLQTVAGEWLGVPYRFGGNDRSGIDCSGLVCVIYETVYGIEMPRSTHLQRRKGSSVHPAYLRPGDLLFFRLQVSGGVDHVGIYLGDGTFIHASSSSGVTLSSLNQPPYDHQFVVARRYRR